MKSVSAYIIFLLSLVILVSLSILYTQRFRELTRYTNQVEDPYQMLLELNDLFSYLKDAETGSRGFLLSNDSSFLHPYEIALDSIKPTLAKVYALSQGHPELIPKIDALNILISERLDIMKHTTLLYKNGDEGFITVLQRGKEKMTECRTLINTIDSQTVTSLAHSKETKAFYEVVTPGFFLVLMGVTAVAFVISFYIILREYNSRLKQQKNVELKIIELNQSYKELEQIAYISSHDLQEPLRKIGIFCDRLSMKYAPLLDEEGQSIIQRIQTSSERTRELVEILSNYTSLVSIDKPKQKVSLISCVDHVSDKFSALLKSKNATLEVETLPEVKGHHDQLNLLLECLVDNSIKFSKPGMPLTIKISTRKIDKTESKIVQSQTAHTSFIKLVYDDNGIGFDNIFSDKIFSIFQRLHTSDEIDGKGVGLAIVKRVMSNHGGFVIAHGVVDEGASFWLYFPEDD